DLIETTSEQAAKAALQSLQGGFSYEIDQLVDQVIHLRMYVEAAIDFPDEEIDFLSDGKVSADLESSIDRLQQVMVQAKQGTLLREGMKVVIAGRPNAGKSSLLNALAGRESAIVTAIAGTTRDTLREHIQIDGMPLHVIDTAGLRDTTDAVEQEGIRRAWNAIEAADRVLLVVDDRIGIGAPEREVASRLPANVGLTVIHNKIDLTGRAPGKSEGELGSSIYLSASTGDGFTELREHLKRCMGFEERDGGFIARRR